MRRSERRLAGTHVLVRYYDPITRPRNEQRVRRWKEAGVVVTVGPPPEEAPGSSQACLDVALACAVTRALDASTYDTVVVFAGDGALQPLFALLAGDARSSPSIERATWVSPSGEAPNGLAAVRNVWCHRLGERAFAALVDDGRPARTRREGGEKSAPTDSDEVLSIQPAPLKRARRLLGRAIRRRR
jgi:hypothetical protein